MVSKASEDLPEPESPVNTTSRSRGISRSMFLRLCSRAPRIAITRAPSADAWRRGRPWSKRSFIRSVARSIGGGQGGHTHQAKEASRRSSPRGAPKERSKNWDVSLARRAAPALSSLSCGQRWRPRHGPQRCGGSPNEPSEVRAFLDGQIRQCDVDTPKRDGRSRVAGGELQWKSFNERRHRVHPRQLHADVFRAGPARFRYRALPGAPAARLCADRRSAVLVFRAVLDRIFVALQFRLSRLFRETGGGLHRMGGQSPFQLEVGFASLGFAVVGLLAFRGSFDLRLAAIVGPACFLWGAAGVHVYQMITAHNFAPGNAGIIFYSDVLVPIVGFIFLWLQHRAARSQQRKSA